MARRPTQSFPPGRAEQAEARIDTQIRENGFETAHGVIDAHLFPLRIARPTRPADGGRRGLAAHLLGPVPFAVPLTVLTSLSAYNRIGTAMQPPATAG